MAKLPSSFRERNRTTRQFRELLARLPRHVYELARKACILFDRDPNHPSLRSHELIDTKKSRHQPGSISISFAMGYRAIYVQQGDQNIWYWIGSHADYDAFTGGK
jgi:hypothetical protein